MSCECILYVPVPVVALANSINREHLIFLFRTSHSLSPFCILYVPVPVAFANSIARTFISACCFSSHSLLFLSTKIYTRERMRRKEEEDDDEGHMFMCAPSTAAATFASFDDEYINNGVIKDSETTVLQTELEETVRELYLKNDEEEDDCAARRTSPTTSSSTTKRTFNLERTKHVEYCLRNVRELHPTYVSLNSSRTWIVYWLVHSLGVLGELDLEEDLQTDVVEFLASCQHESGGFGGGPGQLAHLAPTYAAMSALVTIGTKEAMAVTDVGKLRAWLMRLKTVTTTTRKEDGEDVVVGSFAMHVDGESDVRGSYCALAVAHLCKVLDEELTRGVANYVAECQTHEGGFAGEPGAEAHGGYAYCGIATLVLCDMVVEKKKNETTAKNNKKKIKQSEYKIGVDLDAFEEWLVHRQCGVEGGFNGRTNKLCDGCYSFWIGASFPLLEMVRGGKESKQLLFEERTMEDLTSVPPIASNRDEDGMDAAGDAIGTSTRVDDECLFLGTLRDTAAEMCNLKEESSLTIEVNNNDDAKIQKKPLARTRLSFNARALQGWILGCCQSEKGGLRDKPGKSADFYHTCYCLSGLSVAQWYGELPVLAGGNATAKERKANVVEKTNVLLNVVESKYTNWMDNFGGDIDME